MPTAKKKIEPQTDAADYSWHVFERPHDTWEAMYADCAAAQTSIEFEQYILEDDAVGRRFMELFIEKAKEGVKISLICDRFGSALMYRSKLVNKLRRHGGSVRFYHIQHGLRSWLPWPKFPRTHTKTLLIDSQIAYTGGVCIAERMRHWRDTHVRLTGDVIAQVRQAFDDIYSKKKKKSGAPKTISDTRFQYFFSIPRRRSYSIYKEFEKAVDSAQDYIYITSAFFVINRRFLARLRRAHKRGVDVRILVPERSDVVPADWITLSYTPRFLRAGLRLYHYQENVLHSKTAIIDDKWGTVGSTNFDIISFFLNREGNVMITDSEAITFLKKRFFSDLEESTELNWRTWALVPRWKKITGYFCRILKAFL